MPCKSLVNAMSDRSGFVVGSVNRAFARSASLLELKA